jgi:hypothetical protein
VLAGDMKSLGDAANIPRRGTRTREVPMHHHRTPSFTFKLARGSLRHVIVFRRWWANYAG